jgi:hypothetical protein
MNRFDICLAWSWEFDADFVALIGASCRRHGLSLVEVTAENAERMVAAALQGQVTFQAFFDRASDVEPQLLPLVRWVTERRLYAVNPFEQARRSWNKALVYERLVRAGLPTPLAITVPSFEEQPELPPVALERLGERFVIKPAHGGGGEGVVTGATSVEQVRAARQSFPTDQTMLQTQVTPRDIDGRPAWFRVIFCRGAVFPSWWHPESHRYTPVTAYEEDRLGLGPLRRLTRAIAVLSELELFSTEIALTSHGRFMVIDYVNEPIDLRLQSKAADGVPDWIVDDITERLVGRVVADKRRVLTPRLGVSVPQTRRVPIAYEW